MLKIGIVPILAALLLTAACGPADTAPPDAPGMSATPAEVNLQVASALTPEEIPQAVLDTLPRYPGAEVARPDSALGYVTSPRTSACHGEQCPQVHTASQQWVIQATGEEIEAWYWDQLVSQGYRGATGVYGMRGAESFSSIEFFHPARPDVNVQLHLYPQGVEVTLLDVLVVYLEPLPKPDGPFIPLDVERVEIDYFYNDATTHVITEPDSVDRLASIANSLPVQPDYIHSCPSGREDGGATLTFVSAEGDSWTVRIVHPGCPFRVEFKPHPQLHDTRQLLWEAVQVVTGKREPHEAGSWPGRPEIPTPPPDFAPPPPPPATPDPDVGPPSPTPTPPVVSGGARESDEDAGAIDYAAATGVDMDEARRRAKLLEQVRPTLDSIRAEVSDTLLAGLSIEHEPDLHVRLRLTSDPSPALKSIIDESPVPIIVSTDAAASLSESRRRLDRALPGLQAAVPEPMGTWIDERTGDVVLDVFIEGDPEQVAEAKSRIEAAAASLAQETDLSVRIVFLPAPVSH